MGYSSGKEVPSSSSDESGEEIGYRSSLSGVSPRSLCVSVNLESTQLKTTNFSNQTFV